jgi:hypothetical protein
MPDYRSYQTKEEEATVEMRSHSAYRKGGHGNPPPTAELVRSGCSETPVFRRAGCVARMSGSVGGVPGRLGAPTRHRRRAWLQWEKQAAKNSGPAKEAVDEESLFFRQGVVRSWQGG